MKKNREYKLFPFSHKAASLVSTVLIIALLISSAFIVALPQYVVSILDKTRFYDHEYIEPAKVEIEFPENKRNVIYCF